MTVALMVIYFLTFISASLARSDIFKMDTGAVEENLMEDYSLVDPRVIQIISHATIKQHCSVTYQQYIHPLYSLNTQKLLVFQPSSFHKDVINHILINICSVHTMAFSNMPAKSGHSVV